MPKRALPDEVKSYIVQALARLDTPATVVDAVNREFGIRIPRQQVQRYDPTKRAGTTLSASLRDLFHTTRARLADDLDEVGIAHLGVRLRRLDRMQLRCEAMGNFELALKIGEVAAKERGDAFTNTRVLRGGLELSAPKGLADFYGGAPPQVVGEGEQ